MLRVGSDSGSPQDVIGPAEIIQSHNSGSCTLNECRVCMHLCQLTHKFVVQTWYMNSQKLDTLQQLHCFIHQEHACYSVAHQVCASPELLLIMSAISQHAWCLICVDRTPYMV